MPDEMVRSAGGLVYDEAGRALLIKRGQQSYNLPKGHVESGETPEQAAVRELREETGYDVEIIRHLGVVGRRSVERDGSEVDKQIDLFAVRIIGGELGSDEEAPVWVPYAEAIGAMYHPEEAAFLQANPPGSL